VRQDRAWLAAILAIAALLRAIRLDAGLWYDEIDTLVHFTRLPVSELLTTYSSLNHHVLYSLEAKAAIALFGESAWALRLPAAIFGVASVWALWLLAKEVASGWEARLSALLLSVSYHHVWFSQNARGYTGLLFWGLIATCLFVRGARRPTWRRWAAYGVVAALALYTHLSAALFLASHGLIYFGALAQKHLSTRQSKPFGALSSAWPLAGFAVGALLTVLLYAPLLPQVVETFGAVRAPASEAVAAATAEWKSPLWTFLEIARSFTYLGSFMSVGMAVAVVVTIIGIADLRKTEPVVVAVPLIHIPLTLAILIALSMRIWPRYFFVDLGFVCIFLVRGAFVIGQFIAARWPVGMKDYAYGRGVGILLAALGIVASLALLPRNYLYPKQDFLGARDFIESMRMRDSEVVSLGLATMAYADYYAPQWKSVETLDELARMEQTHVEVWLVYAFPEVTRRRYGEIVDHVSTEFEEVKTFPGTLGGGDLIVFRWPRDRRTA
jgi:uncharacterized membrane protein